MTMNWHEITQLISSGELDRLQRTEECTRRYREHKRALGKMDLSTFVLQRLDWRDDELEFLNNVKFATREEKIQACLSRREFYKVTRNDFPYDFEPSVSHLLVWSKIVLPLYRDDSNGAQQDPDTKDRIDEFFKLNLEDRLGIQSGDYCWFVNYSSLQSIRKISHVHLLVKTANKEAIEDEILSGSGLKPLLDIDGVEKTQESCL